MIGYALCGSFCTLGTSLLAMERLAAEGVEILPIMSDCSYSTDTRFFKSEALCRRIVEITGNSIIHTIVDAEPLGPSRPLEAMIIAPCTGNTLSKLANGIADTAVTMAAKAHLRCDRPLLIALASNDALSANLRNLSVLLNRKSVYFVPMRQDDPTGKPHSLVADFERLPEAFKNMAECRQMRPIFV